MYMYTMYTDISIYGIHRKSIYFEPAVVHMPGDYVSNEQIGHIPTLDLQPPT